MFAFDQKINVIFVSYLKFLIQQQQNLFISRDQYLIFMNFLF